GNLTRRVEFVKQTYETSIAIGSANFRRAAQIITDGVPHPNSPILGQIFARWRNRGLAKCLERFADRKFRPHHEDWSRSGCFDTCLERSRKTRCRSFARASWVILAGPATSDSCGVSTITALARTRHRRS